MAVWPNDIMKIVQYGWCTVWQYEIMAYPHQWVPLQSVLLLSLQSGSQRTETFYSQKAEQILIKIKRHKWMKEIKSNNSDGSKIHFLVHTC